MNKLDGLIAKCEEGLNNRLGHHARLDLFCDTADALRLLRDTAQAVSSAVEAGAIDEIYLSLIRDRLTALRAAGLMGGG